MELGHWNNLTGDDIDINDYVGFIYYIELDDGSYYYGKKKFWKTKYKYSTWSTGRRRRTKYHVESDWASYTSSSDILKAKIKDGGTIVKQDMISIFTTARTLGYAEDLAIVMSGVYEDDTLGINWRLEKVQGKLGMKDVDRVQLERLKERFNVSK